MIYFIQEFFAENLISRIEELLDNMDVSSQEYLKKVRKFTFEKANSNYVIDETFLNHLSPSSSLMTSRSPMGILMQDTVVTGMPQGYIYMTLYDKMKAPETEIV